jgi:hypothetical protein
MAHYTEGPPRPGQVRAAKAQAPGLGLVRAATANAAELTPVQPAKARQVFLGLCPGTGGNGALHRRAAKARPSTPMSIGLVTYARCVSTSVDDIGGVFDMETEDYGDLGHLRHALARLRVAEMLLRQLGKEAKLRSDRAFNDGVEDESAFVHGIVHDYDESRARLGETIIAVQNLIASEQFRLDPQAKFVVLE